MFKLLNCLTVCTVILISNLLIAQEINLTEHLIHNNTQGTGSVYASDLDGDGDLDVLAASLQDNEIVWWRNDGGVPISWTKFTIGQNVYNAHSVFAEDFDGDGDKDVIGAAYYNSPGIALWRNDGGNPITWTKFTVASNFINAHEIYACDLDKDGDFDVLGASSDLNRIAWWRNDGGSPIVWTEQIISSSVTLAKSVHVGDLDGDGDFDLIGAAITAHDVIWWRNDGGQPIQWTQFMIDGFFSGAHRVQSVDIDDDGDQDVLCAGYLGHEIAWYRNEGGDPISWTKQAIAVNFVNACVAYAIDLDGDGDKDVIATAQGDNEIAWWRNEGGDPIQWTRSLITGNFTRPWPLHACDLDGDGDNDIISGSSHNGSNEVKWWENSLMGVRFSANPGTGHAPLTVEFKDNSNTTEQVTTWEWDFNNDGVIDSEEQNPTWTYTIPGEYSVRLKISTNTTSYTTIYEDYIHAFDGKSALLFNNKDSYVSCPASPSLNITDSLTIEAWIYPTGWGESYDNGKIVDKNSISLYLLASHPYYNNQTLVLKLVHADGTTSRSIAPENSISLNEWQHIAVTYDADSTVKMYVNGIEQEASQRTQPFGSITGNSEDDLIIGNSPDLKVTFDGIIDEVRVWETTRTVEEIPEDMNNYLNGNEFGLVGYWKMDEGSGEKISDGTTYRNDGTVVDAQWRAGAPLNSPTQVENSAPPVVLSKQHQLHNNYPNPFNPKTTITFTLSQQANLYLNVYDLNGKLVKSLTNGETWNAGFHSIEWDGKDNHSLKVSSGIYFYKMVSDKTYISKKMLFLK